MTKEMSEFGKGFIICLVKWAEHFERRYDEKTETIMGESGSIEMWANGASDHLYDIETPKGPKWNLVRKMVDELKTKGLEMGHGYTGKKWTKQDVLKLQELTRDIALATDKILGIDGDLGQW